METVITELLKQGPIGAIAVTFIYLYVKERGERNAEMAARVADAVAVRQVLLDVQERALTTAGKFADMYDAASRRFDQGGKS